MCWFHMRKCAENKLALISDQAIRDKILADIDVLQTAPSEQIFDAAAKLFIEKWSKSKDSNIIQYLDYFETEWIKVTKLLMMSDPNKKLNLFF